MAFELREGQGTLFKNDKDGNEKRPDYRGELKLLSGETIKLAGWIKQGAKGSFLSISIDKPREQTGGGGGDFREPDSSRMAGCDRDRQGQDFSDDIPFITF